MNGTCLLFNQECARRIGHVALVVELGSCNVNGSVRALYDADRYIGVDARPGAEVDVVADGCTWQPDALADVVVCNNTLEHCAQPERLVTNAYAMLKPDGLMVLTMPHIAWPPHGIDGAALAEGEHYANVDAKALGGWLTSWGDSEMVTRDGIVCAFACKMGRLPGTKEIIMPEKQTDSGFCTCTDCNRLLYKKDGPICPDCLAKRPKAEPPKVKAEPEPKPKPPEDHRAEMSKARAED